MSDDLIINFHNLSVRHVNKAEQDKLLTFSISENCRRFASDIIYTGDGLFIVRIKNFQECHNVEITVKFGGRNAGMSPYCIKSLLPERCHCPRDIDHVLQSMKCPANIQQIDADLSPFQNVNFTKIRKKIDERFQNYRSASLCNYVVKNNEVFCKCHGQYTGFSMFIDGMLSSLANKVRLPDVEFFINLGDWPLIRRNSEKIPIFSWCGSNDTFDIVLPTYDLTESVLHMLHRVSLDMLSVQKEQWQWEQKIDKAFFRGRDSRRERLDLIDLARKNPELINASITNFFFFTDEMHKYGPKVGHISFLDFFEYKYQINIDGTVAAYRLPYLLAANSVVFKQNSPYYEHFYHLLKPYQHYIPFQRDPKKDLTQKIAWLKKNDEMAKRIAKNARNFARENLMPSNVYCYYILLLKVSL